MRSQLLTCMGGDFVQIVVCVITASNVDERRARDLYGGRSQEFLAGGPFHGWVCPECGVEGL